MALTSVKSFHSPADASSVVRLLQQHEDSALIVAGGTFLHGLDARGLLTGIEALIDIRGLGLDSIAGSPDEVTIGATTRLAQLEENTTIRQEAWLGAVKDAISYPPVQIMNAATVGGSIASACPLFDLPTSFLALNGVVRAHGPDGSRDISLEAFFSGLFENSLAPAEFVTAIRLPAPASPANSSSAFIKLETNANDLAIVNAAVALTLDDANQCEQVRIFIGGGTGETPVRAASAERLLTRTVMDDAATRDAREAVQADVDPISDHRASGEYRTHMAGVLVEQALHGAMARLRGEV